MRNLLLAATAAAFALCGAADARPINDKGLTIEEVSAWVKSAGYTPKIEKNADGDRYVTTKTKDGSVNFDIDLYDCDEAARCRALQFTASFNLKNGLDPAKANEWNRTKRYVRLYLDGERDPIFQYDANVAPGGSYEALDDDLEVFVQFIPVMLEYIDW